MSYDKSDYYAGKESGVEKCYMCGTRYLGFRCQFTAKHICIDCRWPWETMVTVFRVLDA